MYETESKTWINEYGYEKYSSLYIFYDEVGLNYGIHRTNKSFSRFLV